MDPDAGDQDARQQDARQQDDPGADVHRHAPGATLPDLDGALDGHLRSVVELASLAPSVHNTQPWRFTWDGSALEVHEDPSRALPVLDPTGRERVVSCGAAVLHARLALARLGHTTRTSLLPDPADDGLLARISVTGSGQPPSEGVDALVAAMTRRTTDRDPFDDRAVPEPVREALRAAAEAEGAWLRVLGDDDEDDVELQVLLSQADAGQRSDADYLAELAAWRRRSSAEGVPDQALPSVPVGRRGSSWAMRDFSQPGAADEPPPGSEPPPAEHPSVLVIGTTADSREDWVVAGQALGRVLLRATVEGLSAQPLTQALEVPVVRGRLRAALGVVGHPQMLLRIGYGSGAPTTSRRPVDDVLTAVPPA